MSSPNQGGQKKQDAAAMEPKQSYGPEEKWCPEVEVRAWRLPSFQGSVVNRMPYQVWQRRKAH